MFDIEVSDNRIVLSGRLDAAQASKAEQVFSRIEDSTVVDFGDLAYISSAGLGVLFAAQKRLMSRSRGLHLVRLNAHIREVFEIAGFDSLFEID